MCSDKRALKEACAQRSLLLFCENSTETFLDDFQTPCFEAKVLVDLQKPCITLRSAVGFQNGHCKWLGRTFWQLAMGKRSLNDGSTSQSSFNSNDNRKYLMSLMRQYLKMTKNVSCKAARGWPKADRAKRLQFFFVMFQVLLDPLYFPDTLVNPDTCLSWFWFLDKKAEKIWFLARKFKFFFIMNIARRGCVTLSKHFKNSLITFSLLCC